MIWRSRRKMKRNKDLLILHYLRKKLSKFSNAQKKVFQAFSFQLCSTANSKCSYYVSLSEINCIKILTMSIVWNLSILAKILCFIYFTSTFASDWKKVQASWFIARCCISGVFSFGTFTSWLMHFWRSTFLLWSLEYILRQLHY